MNETTKKATELSRRLLDDIIEGIRQFFSDFHRAVGGHGKGFDPRNPQFITWVLSVVAIILASAVLNEGLRRFWPMLGSQ